MFIIDHLTFENHVLIRAIFIKEAKTPHASKMVDEDVMGRVIYSLPDYLTPSSGMATFNV